MSTVKNNESRETHEKVLDGKQPHQASRDEKHAADRAEGRERLKLEMQNDVASWRRPDLTAGNYDRSKAV
jgi:hypothetical protein